MSAVGLGVAGLALEEAIPLGRVWSFPKEIIIPKTGIVVRFVKTWDPVRLMFLRRFQSMTWDEYEADVKAMRQEHLKQWLDSPLTTAVLKHN